jgi:uncharacterized membrane protein
MSPEPPTSPPVPLWRKTRFWLALMVVGFFAVSLWSGTVSYTDLQTSNSTDAGIITQAVASTVHPNVAPFYESYDCMVKTRCSFLLVHPGFVIYLAVPFYALASSTITLMALRSAVVAAAAIPLYWLTRQVTRSPGKGLLAAGLFLVSAPTFAADVFSLHLESLLPLELFTLAALWQSGRYRLGLIVAVIAFLSFEIFPLFTFLVGAFFLFPYIERPIRGEWNRWRDRRAVPRSLRSTLSLGWQYVRTSCRLTEVRYTLLLMLASVAAFIALALFINVWGHEILGLAAPPVGPGIAGVFSNPSSPGVQNLWTILRSGQTATTADYWLITYALVAFIPLLYPRTLILSLPWIGWTFLTDNNRFTTFGHQYGMIAAGPIFIGLAYGLSRVHFDWRPTAVNADSVGAAAREGSQFTARPPGRRWRLPSHGTAWGGVLVVVIVANGLLIPINPILPGLGVVPPSPFGPGYFDHSLEISPSFEWVEDLVSTIPHDATIAAPSAIFPLVASYPDAYVLTAMSRNNASKLPFYVSGEVPEYVFVAPTTGEDSFGEIGSNLSRNLSNPLLYGMSGYVGSTPLGPLLLYERNYTSAAMLFGPGISPVSAVYDPDTGLFPGTRGVEEANSSVPSGKVIASLDQANRSGLVWSGPDVFLGPGNYTVQLLVAMAGPNLTSDPNSSALRIAIGGVGETPVNVTLRASTFSPGRWMNLTFRISLLDPLPEVDVKGILPNDLFSVAVASVTISPGNP